jgi:hypothetical protein
MRESSNYLTVGKSYRVVSFDSRWIRVIQDDGRLNGFPYSAWRISDKPKVIAQDALKPFNGKFYDTSFGVSDRLVGWLNIKTKYKFMDVVYTYWPSLDITDTNVVWAWLDTKGREKGREGRQPIKPGKLFKRMCPYMTDQEIAILVDQFKEVFQPRKFTVIESYEAESFRHAYSHKIAEARNIETTGYYKHISSSCMRHNFEQLPNHPTEAYASGEFSIVYATDSKGFIGGRSVVWHNPGSGKSYFAPIYGACSDSINSIEDYVKGKGYIEADGGDWNSAKLKAIPFKGGYIAPYLDISPRSLDEYDSDYLVICRYGSIDASCYSGLLGADICTCENCERDVAPEDSYSDDNGNRYCESCWDELFTYCHYSDETVRLDHTVTVNTRVGEETWADWNARAYATYISRLNEWYEDGLVYTDVDGNSFTTDELEEGDWFMCDRSEGFYPNDCRCETVAGESIAKDNLPDTYQLNDDGLWEDIQETLDFEGVA